MSLAVLILQAPVSTGSASAFAAQTDHATLTAEAEQVPAGSLGVSFCPFLRLANPPYNDPKARGAFLGLSTDVQRGTLFRAVLEGIALDTRNGLEPLLVHTGVGKLEEIYAIGGSTRNRLLMQIKASVLNQPIHVMSIEESTALGGSRPRRHRRRSLQRSGRRHCQPAAHARPL